MSESEANKEKALRWGKSSILGMIILSYLFGINFDTLSLIKHNQTYATFLDQTMLPLLLFSIILMGVNFIYLAINKEKGESALRFPRLTLGIAFCVVSISYFIMVWGLPLAPYLYEDIENVRIETRVVEKERDTSRNARRGLTCDYKIYFSYEDIPKRSYICMDRDDWQALKVGEIITIDANKTSLGYKLNGIITEKQ